MAPTRPIEPATFRARTLSRRPALTEPAGNRFGTANPGSVPRSRAWPPSAPGAETGESDDSGTVELASLNASLISSRSPKAVGPAAFVSVLPSDAGDDR